ncbi:hypothetical protein G9A89_000338, partial [Geosiphon pyriformis]
MRQGLRAEGRKCLFYTITRGGDYPYAICLNGLAYPTGSLITKLRASWFQRPNLQVDQRAKLTADSGGMFSLNQLQPNMATITRPLDQIKMGGTTTSTRGPTVSRIGPRLGPNSTRGVSGQTTAIGYVFAYHLPTRRVGDNSVRIQYFCIHAFKQRTGKTVNTCPLRAALGVNRYPLLDQAALPVNPIPRYEGGWTNTYLTIILHLRSLYGTGYDRRP